MCELDFPSQSKCLCFTGHEASSAKLASDTVIVERRPAAAEGHGGLSLRAYCFHRLILPHNDAVTSYLLGAMSASPDLHDADNDAIVCK